MVVVALDDDDFSWTRHSGKGGHRDAPEWSERDGALAEAFYAALDGPAKAIFDLMIDHPDGLDADWIADQILSSEDHEDRTQRRSRISGYLAALSEPRKASQRRYPFYWRRDRGGSPTRYWMTPPVARLFHETRSAVSPALPVPQPSVGRGQGGARASGYHAWSFLSLERTARLAIGDTGYPDELGVRYVFDSTVANHGSVKVGDLAVIRDDKVVLGAGWIDDLQLVLDRKIRYRCPSCQKTDFKFRSRAKPRFRCAACGTEFDNAEPEDITVQSYSAGYARTWRPADSFFATEELAPAYMSNASQNSIRRLDPGQLAPLLDAHLVTGNSWWNRNDGDPEGPPGGHAVAFGKTRLGQQRFRMEMLKRFGNNCAFTGPQPPQCLEAAHLYLYSKSPQHDLRGGLLMRRDLHSLFDNLLITIDPISWKIEVSPELECYTEVTALRGMPLKVPIQLRPRVKYLEDHVSEARSMWPSPERMRELKL